MTHDPFETEAQFASEVAAIAYMDADPMPAIPPAPRPLRVRPAIDSSMTDDEIFELTGARPVRARTASDDTARRVARSLRISQDVRAASARNQESKPASTQNPHELRVSILRYEIAQHVRSHDVLPNQDAVWLLANYLEAHELDVADCTVLIHIVHNVMSK